MKKIFQRLNCMNISPLQVQRRGSLPRLGHRDRLGPRGHLCHPDPSLGIDHVCLLSVQRETQSGKDWSKLVISFSRILLMYRL